MGKPSPAKINRLLRRYALTPIYAAKDGAGSWLRQPELPTSNEILGLDEPGRHLGNTDGAGDGGVGNGGGGSSSSSGTSAFASATTSDVDDNTIAVPVNRINEPWDNVEDYLRTHYELLREDAVAPLRDAVAQVRQTPDMMDDKTACIYEQVCISPVLPCTADWWLRCISRGTLSQIKGLLRASCSQPSGQARRFAGTNRSDFCQAPLPP